MRKYNLLWIVLLVLLSACSGRSASTPEPTVPPTTNPQAVAPVEEPVLDCTIASVMPTPGPTEQSLFPAPNEEDWARGPADAPITFLEYSDFQCPGCRSLAPSLRKIEEEFPEDVRVIYRHFPLSFHANAPLAAQAAEAAGAQGKFWEMHDLLFSTQPEWAELSVEAFEAYLLEQAGELELDTAQFETDLKDPAIVEKIRAAQAEGERIQIPYTPFLLINGKILQIPQNVDPYSFLRTLVPVVKLQDIQYSTCPTMTIDPTKQYIATIKTEKGDIVVELYPDKAPITVNSFVFLAREGWYDNVTFHRVVSDPDVAQAGDPSGTGWGGPGYAFRDEITDLKFDKPGVLAMANAGPHTNGSQFFITKSPISFLDGKYTIFGQVIEGMDVVNALAPRDPSTQMDPAPGDQILSITIEEK